MQFGAKRGEPGHPAGWRRLVALAGIALAAAAGPLLAPRLWPDDAAAGARLAQLDSAAQALAAALDAEVARHATAIAALAAAPGLDAPEADLPGLDAQARATATVLGAPVAIADPSLLQLSNTALPFGTPLEALEDAQTAWQALESGTVAVGALPGDAAGAPGIGIAVPARRQGGNVAVVTTRIEAAGLAHVLEGPARAGLLAALADRGGRVLTASVPAAAVPAALLRAAALPAGGGHGSTGGTEPLEFALAAPQTLPGWNIIAARPLPAPALPWRGSLFAAALAGGLAWLAAALLRPGRAASAVFARQARAAAASEALALRSLGELKSLHDTIPVGLGLLDRELCFLSVNVRLAAVSGVPGREHLGRRPAEVLPPGLARAIEDAHARVMATARPVLELPVAAEAPGAVLNLRHLLVSGHPVLDAEGRLSGVSLVLQDVTERVHAERGRELLLRELNHRVKNTLATVQSIVSSTLRRPDIDPQRLGAVLGARLRALACAHDLLTAHSWNDAELLDVVRAAMKPWLDSAPGRVMIDGSTPVLLRPSQAQAVVLALHELATNAVKYGALSGEAGCVTLFWRTDPAGITTMEWVEAGGPPVTPPPPEKRGFGTRLLERALASDLGAGTEVRLIFAPEGLRARIVFAGTRLAEPEAAEPVMALPEGEPPRPRLLAQG